MKKGRGKKGNEKMIIPDKRKEGRVEQRKRKNKGEDEGN